jgi:hypothetical protein
MLTTNVQYQSEYQFEQSFIIHLVQSAAFCVPTKRQSRSFGFEHTLKFSEASTIESGVFQQETGVQLSTSTSVKFREKCYAFASAGIEVSTECCSGPSPNGAPCK